MKKINAKLLMQIRDTTGTFSNPLEKLDKLNREIRELELINLFRTMYSTEWVVCVHTTNEFVLKTSKLAHEIGYLHSRVYHVGSAFFGANDKAISIHTGGNYWSISGKLELIVQFAKLLNLSVDFSDISDSIDELNSEIFALEKICGEFDE